MKKRFSYKKKSKRKMQRKKMQRIIKNRKKWYMAYKKNGNQKITTYEKFKKGEKGKNHLKHENL